MAMRILKKAFLCLNVACSLMCDFQGELSSSWHSFRDILTNNVSDEIIASLSVLQGRYGSMCEKVQVEPWTVQPRSGNKSAEQTATKVEILQLMDRIFDYRTKSGLFPGIFSKSGFFVDTGLIIVNKRLSSRYAAYHILPKSVCLRFS